MSAAKVFGAGIALGVIGRWANGKSAFPPLAGSLQVTGALILVAVMDRGRTEPVAKGLAWLFLAAVLLSDNSPITGLTRAESLAPAHGGPFPGGGGGRIPNSSGAPGTGGGPFPGAGPATGTGYTARATPTPRRTP